MHILIVILALITLTNEILFSTKSFASSSNKTTFGLGRSNTLGGSNPFSSQAARKCKFTPQIVDNRFKPTQYSQSNNLRRTGGAHSATGENIMLYGQLVDTNCTPIAGATIYIWQANSYGVYQDSENVISPNSDPRANTFFDPLFAGSGTVISDKNGIYSFLTVMPGRDGINAPHINLVANHPNHTNLQTKIFFSEKIGNLDDPSLAKLPVSDQSRLIALTFGDQGSSDQSGFGMFGNNAVYTLDIVLQ
jgi:protocatechuate 3,4-dioxygenase beta subunit